MYIESDDLLRQIATVSAKSDSRLTLAEYAALPHYGGHIVLRFDVKAERISREELLGYEQELTAAAGGFMVDFTADVHRKLGLEPVQVAGLLAQAAREHANEPVVDSVYKEFVLADARTLLRQAGLSRFSRVWELRPGNPAVMLLLGSENRLMKQVSAEDRSIYVFEFSADDCDAQMKAAFYAKRTGQTLTGLLLNQ